MKSYGGRRDLVVVPEGHAKEAIARLRRGGTTLRFQAKRLGIPHSRGALRQAMVKVLGSEEALTQLLAETDPNRNPMPPKPLGERRELIR